MEEYNNRKLLNEVEDVSKTGTLLDEMPKDLLSYLRGYTGPQSCVAVLNNQYIGGGGGMGYDKATIVSGVWINKDKDQVGDEARKKGQLRFNTTIETSKLVFLDGSPYVLLPVAKNNIYGVKKRRRKKQDKPRSVRCRGRKVDGKRCKNRVKKGDNSPEFCQIHRE